MIWYLYFISLFLYGEVTGSARLGINMEVSGMESGLNIEVLKGKQRRLEAIGPWGLHHLPRTHSIYNWR